MNIRFTKNLLIICVVIPFSIITTLSCVAIMIEYDLNRLIKESSHIVMGKVVKKESHWNELRTEILTDVTIEIAKSFKGKADKFIIVQYSGGEITNPDGTGIGMGRSDMPRFNVDEEVLLFLHKTPESSNYKLTADFQGKFSIELNKETGSEEIKSSAKVLVDPETMRAREVSEYNVPLKKFVAELKKKIKQQAKLERKVQR